MNKDQALAYLRDNPVFWSRLGFCYDPPILDENHTPFLIEHDFEKLQGIHDQFSDAGVKIHTCILHNGWVGVDKYDYTLCDRVVESIFASGKAKYYIPRIKLNPPIEWCCENPTELLVYEDGPQDVEEIRALVGGLKQDWLGYESALGYYNANGAKDSRPNVGGVIALQSFSSEKWLQDAGEALRRLVRHLEERWGERILAYHIAYGACGESMLWGRQSGKFGDYGIANQTCFSKWGLRKYESQRKLEEMWGQESKEMVVPPSKLREKRQLSEEDLYKDEITDRWSIDYDIFMSEVNTNALMYFGKVIKDTTDDKPVGAFYGYILHMARCAYSGHLGWKRLLESKYVDFFAAPKSYIRCEPGEPGGEMAPTVSVNRTRLWVDECDNRTHLTVGDVNSNAACAEETYTVQLRELCKNITHNSGLWYMDLGGGWYNDEGIMKHIEKLLKVSDIARQKEYKSIAQITVIVDEYSILCTHPSVVDRTEQFLRDLQLAGAPVDVIFSHDIGKVDLKNTRLAVLPNPVCMDEKIMGELYRTLSEEACVLYCGKSNVNMREHDFVIPDWECGVKILREIVEQAGVHCYAPMECAVYADSRIISFFPRTSMTFNLALPEHLQLIDVLTETVYNPNTMLTIEGKRGMAFHIVSHQEN